MAEKVKITVLSLKYRKYRDLQKRYRKIQEMKKIYRKIC